MRSVMLFADFLFPVSGVETNILVPPLVALFISFFTSMAGVSGAFLLLPFQMSVLNYTSPSVSGTNLVFNIVAIPSGVYRYIKEGRMVWPLVLVVILGTLPGTFVGYFLRVRYLPDPRTFKLFVGIVLLYMGIRLLHGLLGEMFGRTSKKPSRQHVTQQSSIKVSTRQNKSGVARSPVFENVGMISMNLRKIEFEFSGEIFSLRPAVLFFAALVVGVIGGAFGIGGGALIAPFCVTILNLPVYAVAGAALMGTFLTSIAGVIFYSLIPISGEVSASPDWLLGLMFGIGGFAGMYLGARCQKYMPQNIIKLMLGMVLFFLALKYITQFF